MKFIQTLNDLASLQQSANALFQQSLDAVSNREIKEPSAKNDIEGFIDDYFTSKPQQSVIALHEISMILRRLDRKYKIRTELEYAASDIDNFIGRFSRVHEIKSDLPALA